jgi:hypothetical protein
VRSLTNTHLIIFSLTVLLIAAVAAAPPLPCEFSGTVAINGQPAPAGTVISAVINGNESGTITIPDAGVFGGSDTFAERLVVSGGEEDAGQIITFLIDGDEADQTAVFSPGTSSVIALTVRHDTPAITPAPADPSATATPLTPAAGGGGASPAATATPSPAGPAEEYISSAPLTITAEGIVDSSIVVNAEDRGCSLCVEEGTHACDRNGNPLTSVEIVPVNDALVAETPVASASVLPGHAYACEPSGATFEPSAELRFYLDEQEWDAYVPDDLIVCVYREETGEWENIPFRTDEKNRAVRADVTHFSLFALFTGVSDAAATTGDHTASSADHTPHPRETPDDPAPEPERAFPVSWMAAGFILLGVFGVSIYYLLLKKG